MPVNVKSVAVSFTIRPVTQTAEVDVNKAFMNEIPLLEIGRRRSMPNKIIPTYTREIDLNGDHLFIFKEIKSHFNCDPGYFSH